MVDVNDVPAMLRELADNIERGVWGAADAVTVLIPRANKFPAVLMFGKTNGLRDAQIACTMASHYLTLDYVGFARR